MANESMFSQYLRSGDFNDDIFLLSVSLQRFKGAQVQHQLHILFIAIR